jgi:hypothetical protein
MVPETSTVQIYVGETDVTNVTVFSQTSFQVAAGAQPGSCQVTLREYPHWPKTHHPHDPRPRFSPGRDQIQLLVDGVRMWWGYLFVLEQGFLFPDDPEPKIVLRGVDLNILFDKLVMYNHTHENWYPDGGGTYQRQKVVGDDGKVSGYVVSVPQNTTDKSYIQTMMADFDIDLVGPTIKYGQAPFAPSDCKIFSISMINTGDTSATWTPPGPGTTLRGFFEDVSRNIVRSQPGSAVWYIDPEGYIVWKEQDTDYGFPVGDGVGVTPCRSLSITTDVSRLKNDVLVFAGKLDPTPQSTQEFLYYAHKTNNPSVNLFGRFQWSEVMGSDWMLGMINARANKVLTQEGIPAMRAEFTIYRPGLYPGMIVPIFSDAHVFMVYDPTTGLQSQDHVNLPIRAIDMSFPTPNVVEYRVTCSYDTQDPWGLLLALKRPATRGLVQPNFNVIDMSDPTKAYTYVEASPMVLVKEYPQPLSGSRWQCSYAYIRNSLTVVVEGLRRTSVPDPQASGVIGFLEIDPDKGIFKTEASITKRPYVEYHVWHNLTD